MKRRRCFGPSIENYESELFDRGDRRIDLMPAFIKSGRGEPTREVIRSIMTDFHELVIDAVAGLVPGVKPHGERFQVDVRAFAGQQVVEEHALLQRPQRVNVGHIGRAAIDAQRGYAGAGDAVAVMQRLGRRSFIDRFKKRRQRNIRAQLRVRQGAGVHLRGVEVGKAAAIADESALTLAPLSPAHFLLFDLA